MSKPFRLVADHDSEPIPYSRAQPEFQSAWGKAREAYIDLFAKFPGHWAKGLLLGRKSVAANEVRWTRNEAKELVERANLLLATLDEALSIVNRAVPDETTEPR